MPLKRSGFKKKNRPWRDRSETYRKRHWRHYKEKLWARTVKERDGNRCLWPGGCQTGDARLDAHHIAERSQRPDLKLDVDNGITLCRTHHDWIPLHRQEAIRMKLLSDETYEAAMKAGRA